METQELVTQIQNLPLIEQGKVLEMLKRRLGPQPVRVLSEEEAQRILFAQGVISNIPDLSAYTDVDEDFAPVEFSGPPISETIIEERR